MAEEPEQLVYVVDTSSWLSIEGHPAQNRILSRLFELASAGKIKIPPEVLDELERISDIAAWVNQHKELLIERNTGDVEYLLLGGRIAHEFPAMAGARGRRNKADPWVIATAIIANNPHIRTVVCNETLANRPNRKIPTACQKYGIGCFPLFNMLSREFPDDGWEEEQ